MPNLTKLIQLAITPEQFVNSCDVVELQELHHLLINRFNAIEVTPETQAAGHNSQDHVQTCTRCNKIIHHE